MATCANEQIFYILSGFWLVLGVECYTGASNHTLTIKAGGSENISCHYDEKNPPQKKYWYSVIDESKKYTNTTEENLSVIDHPDQSLFTVTMRNIQKNQSGLYYCVVETKGKLSVTTDFYLQVQSVNKTTDTEKSGTSETGSNNNNTTEGLETNKELLIVWLPVSAALLLLMILVGAFSWRKRRHNQDKHQNRERNNSNAISPIYCEAEERVIYSTINDEQSNNPIKDTTYSTITDASGSEAKPPAGGAVYSTVAPH